MSTREADHERGNYFMHTGFVPNPTVIHPTFGSVIAKEVGRASHRGQAPVDWERRIVTLASRVNSYSEGAGHAQNVAAGDD